MSVVNSSHSVRGRILTHGYSIPPATKCFPRKLQVHLFSQASNCKPGPSCSRARLLLSHSPQKRVGTIEGLYLVDRPPLRPVSSPPWGSGS